MNYPKLVVFDLDFTLWDCGGTYCDCLSPPFRKEAHRVLDRRDYHVQIYSDVLAILESCEENGCSLALASRTEQPRWAEQLIDLLGIADWFEFREIYPSSKLRHFDALQTASQFRYEDMLFFDDERRNIHEVRGLGVTSIFVPNGMTQELWEAGLEEFRAGCRE